MNQVRLRTEMRMLWARADVHSHLAETFQVVIKSIIVGTRTFSIVVSLSFVAGLSHVFGLLQPEGLGLRWLHRRTRPIK